MAGVGGPSASSLDRRLGPLDAAAIIVSNVIGGGILFTPPQIAAAVPSALLFLSTWVAGGALASPVGRACEKWGDQGKKRPKSHFGRRIDRSPPCQAMQ